MSAKAGPGHAPRRHVWRWVLALLCLVVGAVGGLGAQLLLPRTYTATATVLVLPTRVGVDSAVAGSRAGLVEIETEAELARSADTTKAAADKLKGSLSATQLRNQSTVTIPQNSSVLMLAVTANRGATAADGANALATAYLAQRNDRAAAEVKAVTDSLSAQVDALNKQIEDNSNKIAGLAAGDVAGKSLAESQRSLLVSQLSDVSSRLSALQAGTASGGQVITTATVPDSPTSPRPLITIGAGLLAGAMAGAALLLLAEHREQRRVRGRRQTLMTPMAVLEVDPHSPIPTAKQRTEIAATNRVCAEVDAFMEQGGPVALLTIGSTELTSAFAQRFAEYWARDHGGGVLVRPESTARDQRGLADILRGEATLAEASVVEAGHGFSVLERGRGSVPQVPSGLRAGLGRLWVEIIAERGAVVIETSGPPETVEAQSVLRTATAIVMVLGDSPDEAAVSATLEDLEVIGAASRVVGSVEVHPPSLESEPASPAEKAPESVATSAKRGWRGRKQPAAADSGQATDRVATALDPVAPADPAPDDPGPADAQPALTTETDNTPTQPASSNDHEPATRSLRGRLISPRRSTK